MEEQCRYHRSIFGGTYLIPRVRFPWAAKAYVALDTDTLLVGGSSACSVPMVREFMTE